MDKGNFSKLSTPCTPTKRNLNRETDEIDIEYITPKKCAKKIDTTVQKTKRLQKYKSQWEIEHGAWLTNDPLNEYNGKCKLCGVTFTIASAGIGQVSGKIFCACMCCVYVCVCFVMVMKVGCKVSRSI